jgi:uncharacterized protein YbaP (TraB family)
MSGFVCFRSFALATVFGCALNALNAASVWKVTGPTGSTIYLGGSIHALEQSDYPLPPAYNRALDASTRLILEEDPKNGEASFKALMRAGEYPKGDNLKNHVDPRTYAYLRRFFALLNVPEEKYSRLRPWLIETVLELPPPQFYQLGVEAFLLKRARATSKSIGGLESPKDHNEAFVGLSDRQSEELLLLFFINATHEGSRKSFLDAWRRGDVDFLAQQAHQEFSELPWMVDRVYLHRNRNWVPKIEEYLRTDARCFVLVGAGHLGGREGLVALLRGRGCKLEQL